jgi:hypothetical protein
LFLQKPDCDLLEAIAESKVTIKRIQDERNDPAVWDAIFDCVVKLAAEFDIPPIVPRRVGRQQHRANYNLNDHKDYWRVSLFLVFSDHLVHQMNERLVKNEDRFKAECLDHSVKASKALSRR